MTFVVNGCFLLHASKALYFDYNELSKEQHQQALDLIFHDGDIKGCRAIETAIKAGYTQCGFSYPNSKVKKLKTFLQNKRMIVYQDATYKYNPDFVW